MEDNLAQLAHLVLDLKFARKALKHEKFKKWFQYNEKSTKARFKQPRICPIYARTKVIRKVKYAA